MKKFLSLVLALVMTMSLVTISAGAKDFTDADKVNYDEAISVLSAVKVIDGYPDGSFKPQTQLNRGQAAKILCNMILGPTTASALKADAAPFKDVPADNTFAGYIAYCAKAGIIDGYTDGTFKPTAPLTGYAFMKLLLGALGYDKDIEGYNVPNWSINVAKQALGIGLDKGLLEDFDGTKIVTREEACLYALNTLKATMVEYGAKTSVNVGDATVVIAGSKAQDVEQGTYKSFTNNAKDETLEFCEKYFKDLKLAPASDDFGRPANTWKVKNTEIGTFANKADLVATFTKKVTKAKMYETVGKSVYDALTDKKDSSSLDVFFNGERVVVAATGANDKDVIDQYVEKNNTGKVNGTGNGDLTEVYVDSYSNVTIVTLRTYLFQAATDYDSKKESVNLTTDAEKYDTKIVLTSRTLKAEDFPAIKDLKEDDYVLVTAVKDVKTDKYTVKSVEKAETVTEEVTGYKYDGDITTTAKTYDYAAGASTIKQKEYNVGHPATLVLDKYGYVIGVDEAVVLSDYVYISKFGTTSSLNSKAVANATFADGTSAEIVVKEAYDKAEKKQVKDKATIIGFAAKPAQTGWFTFSKNSAGEYTLYNIEKKYTESTIDYSKKCDVTKGGDVAPLIGNGTLFNDKTVVVVNDKNNDLSVYTGVKNVPTIKLTDDVKSFANVSMLTKDGYATLVYIDVDGPSTISGDKAANLVYVISYDGKYVTTDNVVFHKYTVLEGEEKVKIESEDKIAEYPGDVYAAARYVTKNADGRLTNFELVDEPEDVVIGGAGNAISQSAGTLTIGGKSYRVAEDAKITLVTLGELKDANKKVIADARALNKDKDASYEAAANISAKELADSLKGYIYTYAFGGKVNENDGNIITELYVTVWYATDANVETVDVTVNGVAVEPVVKGSTSVPYTAPKGYEVTAVEGGKYDADAKEIVMDKPINDKIDIKVTLKPLPAKSAYLVLSGDMIDAEVYADGGAMLDPETFDVEVVTSYGNVEAVKYTFTISAAPAVAAFALREAEADLTVEVVINGIAFPVPLTAGVENTVKLDDKIALFDDAGLIVDTISVGVDGNALTLNYKKGDEKPSKDEIIANVVKALAEKDVTIVDVSVDKDGKYTFVADDEAKYTLAANKVTEAEMVTIYLDGKPVMTVKKGETVNVPGATEKKYIYSNKKVSNTMGALKGISANADRYLYTAFTVTVPDSKIAEVKVVDGEDKLTVNSSDKYVAKDAELIVTVKAGETVKINDEVVTAGEEAKVVKKTVDSDITIAKYETAGTFAENMTKVIEKLEDAKPTDGTIAVEGKNITLTITSSEPGATNLGSIFVSEIESLLAQKYTVKLRTLTGSTKNLASGSVWTTIATVLGDVLTESGAGDEIEFKIIVDNGYDSSDEYSVTVVNDIKA